MASQRKVKSDGVEDDDGGGDDDDAAVKKSKAKAVAKAAPTAKTAVRIGRVSSVRIPDARPQTAAQSGPRERGARQTDLVQSDKGAFFVRRAPHDCAYDVVQRNNDGDDDDDDGGDDDEPPVKAKTASVKKVGCTRVFCFVASF